MNAKNRDGANTVYLNVTSRTNIVRKSSERRMVKIKKTSDIRIRVGRGKREKGREERRERRGKQGEKRKRETVLHEKRHVEIRPRRLRVFCGSLMKTVIEYVHYEV